jgi:peptidoglycan-associated lipoprotein
MSTARRLSFIVLVLLAVVVGGCNRRRPPVAAPMPPPAQGGQPPGIAPAAPPPPQRVEEALPVPQQPALADDALANRSLDELNRNSPLTPVFFTVDSAELDETARATASTNADILRKNARWIVTIEGHCDERGTPEYNLALGERRAVAVKSFLVSLGIAPDRIRTVSYGNEFPFDPARNEEAYSKNRRGHFVITSN